MRYLVWFSLLALAGAVATLFPVFWIGCLAAIAALGVFWMVFAGVRRAGLELWQAVAAATISGYLVLNYGFDNIAFHIGGFPILLSYGAMYGALALAVTANRNLVARIVKEPPVACALAILTLAFCHLAFDIPSYGTWAIRDCTMCFDSLFLLMGLIWARKRESLPFVAKWLMLVFTANMFYSYTLPWAEKIWGWSPVSGAFLEVPIFGNYNGCGDMLLAGAMFCLCVGAYVVRRPSWLMPVLAVMQLLGIAITQVRRMYLGIVIVVLILIAVGEIKKFAKLFILVPVSILVVFAVTTLGGLQITGRIGPVNMSFFRDHIRSLSGDKDAPGSSVESRFVMKDQAMQHFLAHPVFGEGFGQPLLNEVDPDTGAVTRMPHNSSITYLARLGIVGFSLWVLFHLCLLKRFLYAFHQRHSADKRMYAFALWFFLFYVIFMIGSFVEAPFEYPSRAIPFYFLMGFGLGLIRWHLSAKSSAQSSLTPVEGTEQVMF